MMDTTLAVLDKREAGLKKLAKELTGLKIKSVDDREGFAVVREARITLKNERVQVTKDAESLREGAVKFQKAVIAREKELVGIIEPVEVELQAEEKRIEIEKEALRKEKERKEAERIQQRVNALSRFGHGIDFHDAKELTDEKFNELLTQAEIHFNEEKARREQEATNQKAELERMTAERAELDKVKAEQERLRKEQEVREIKFQAEQEKKDKAFKAEQERLAKEKQDFEDQKRREAAEKKRLEELELAKKQAAERALIEAQEKAKREAKEKEEREILAKAEAERLEALRPDQEKINDMAERIKAVKFPEVSNKESLALLGQIGSEIIKLSDSIKSRAAKL